MGPELHLLVAGQGCAAAGAEAARITGVARVLLADDPAYGHALPENLGLLVTSLARNYTHVVAPATAVGRSFMPRVAALLDVAQLSDIVAVEAPDTFVRPIYAGNALAVVQSPDPIKVVTVRGTGFAAAGREGAAEVEAITAGPDAGLSRFVSQELTVSSRPELTAARAIVSGGRGMQNGDNFKLLEALADRLGAA